tara:strand:+ start:41309 stop:43318 length:2010 start_codon:yes stop_codon:yes gene_type:complete
MESSSYKRFSWHRMYHHWLKDIQLWFYYIGLLMLCRLSLLVTFYDHREATGTALNLFLALKQGWLYDCRMATFAILPTLLLSFFLVTPTIERWLNHLRRGLGIFLSSLTVILGIINIGFFAEYHDQFNHWIFGLVYDDLSAIVETVWKTYPVIGILVAVVLLLSINLWAVKRWMRIPVFSTQGLDTKPCPWALKGLVTLVTVACIVFAARGTIYGRLLKEREVQVTDEQFLTNITLNHYYALFFTYRFHLQAHSVHGLEAYYTEGSIKDALKGLFPENPSEPTNFDEYFAKQAQEGPKVNAKHIFIVVMESQEKWPMMAPYDELNLMPRLQEMADKGLSVPAFTSAASSTMESLVSIMTGLPEVGVFTQWQQSSAQTYPTSIAKIAKQLGYETHFFYGGSTSWQNLGPFALNQGFDHIHGCAALQKTDNLPGNRWGVEDKYLFEHILKTIDPDKPSLSVIMTTTNHPPHDVDVYGAGFPLKAMPESLQAVYDGTNSLEMLGHYWYCDKCVGDFVENASEELEAPLFFITADHSSRRFLNKTPNAAEAYLVPLVIYSPEGLNNYKVPTQAAGSHTDIPATLIEMIAPTGFEYYAFGHNILDEEALQLGLGHGNVLTHEGIFDGKEGRYLGPIDPLQEPSQSTEDFSRLARFFSRLKGAGWWRIMKGNTLE